MKTLLLLSIMLIEFNAFSQTNVSGGIYSNTTWTVTNSPYIITGPVVVFPEATLTIESGTEVRVDDGYGVEIRGKLIAIGAEENPIIFTSNSSAPSKGSWRGFLFNATTDPLGVGDQATMEYCIFSFAGTCFDFDIAYHGPYIFNHCEFFENEVVNYQGGFGGCFFDHCYFHENTTGLSWFQFGGRVSNSIFENNNYGVDNVDTIINCLFTGHTQIAVQPYGHTENCTIINNNIGVKNYFNNANAFFKGNVVRNNNIGLEFITIFTDATIQISNNTICDNYQYNVKNDHSNDAVMKNNCWCTTDSLVIRNSIYDGYENTASGIVHFMPVADSCASGYEEEQVQNPEVSIVQANLDAHATSPEVVMMYPNPVIRGDHVAIQFNGNESTHAALYDWLGRKVKILNTIPYHDSSILEFSTSDLNAGAYYLIPGDDWDNAQQLMVLE